MFFGFFFPSLQLDRSPTFDSRPPLSTWGVSPPAGRPLRSRDPLLQANPFIPGPAARTRPRSSCTSWAGGWTWPRTRTHCTDGETERQSGGVIAGPAPVFGRFTHEVMAFPWPCLAPHAGSGCRRSQRGAGVRDTLYFQRREGTPLQLSPGGPPLGVQADVPTRSSVSLGSPRQSWRPRSPPRPQTPGRSESRVRRGLQKLWGGWAASFLHVALWLLGPQLPPAVQ